MDAEFVAFNADEKAAAARAFSLIESYSSVSFSDQSQSHDHEVEITIGKTLVDSAADVAVRPGHTAVNSSASGITVTVHTRSTT